MNAKKSSLKAFTESVDRYNDSQANSRFLSEIRSYNHLIVDALQSIRMLKGLNVLDVGASPHGYALERVMAHGAARYLGIGLDIQQREELEFEAGGAELVNMNAEELTLPASSFDVVVSMSTFEHIARPAQALAEIRRVLKPGGTALITFEPVWTASYGHHLHHFGEVAKLVPAWSHLIWTREEFEDQLGQAWPHDAPLTVAQAAHWTYDGGALNRIGVQSMRKVFQDCGMHCEWLVPLMDIPQDPARLKLASERTGLGAGELMTKGLSVLLHQHH